jgi:hypothetical protein
MKWLRLFIFVVVMSVAMVYHHYRADHLKTVRIITGRFTHEQHSRARELQELKMCRYVDHQSRLIFYVCDPTMQEAVLQ